MRISRLTLGFIAVPIAIVIALTLAFLEAAIIGRVHPILIIFLAAVGAGGVFTLAHRMGLLAERDTPSILTLSDHDSEGKPTGDRARPVVPK